MTDSTSSDRDAPKTAVVMQGREPYRSLPAKPSGSRPRAAFRWLLVLLFGLVAMALGFVMMQGQRERARLESALQAAEDRLATAEKENAAMTAKLAAATADVQGARMALDAFRKAEEYRRQLGTPQTETVTSTVSPPLDVPQHVQQPVTGSAREFFFSLVGCERGKVEVVCRFKVTNTATEERRLYLLFGQRSRGVDTSGIVWNSSSAAVGREENPQWMDMPRNVEVNAWLKFRDVPASVTAFRVLQVTADGAGTVDLPNVKIQP